jgi:hypothetical protein
MDMGGTALQNRLFVLPLAIGLLPTRIRAVAPGRALERHAVAAARALDRLAVAALAFSLARFRAPVTAVGLLAFARAVGRTAMISEERTAATPALLQFIVVPAMSHVAAGLLGIRQPNRTARCQRALKLRSNSSIVFGSSGMALR